MKTLLLDQPDPIEIKSVEFINADRIHPGYIFCSVKDQKGLYHHGIHTEREGALLTAMHKLEEVHENDIPHAEFNRVMKEYIKQ